MISMFQEATFNSMLYKTWENSLCKYLYDVIGGTKEVMGGLG